MKANRIFLFLGISALAVTAGCESKPNDIARCVTELRELERLGQIKDAIPTTKSGRILNPDELKMAEIDTPEREGYLFSEHKNYSDFEGCMDHAGWERTQTVTYQTSKKAKRNYLANHVDFKGIVPDMGGKAKEGSVNDDRYND